MCMCVCVPFRHTGNDEVVTVTPVVVNGCSKAAVVTSVLKEKTSRFTKIQAIDKGIYEELNLLN